MKRRLNIRKAIWHWLITAVIIVALSYGLGCLLMLPQGTRAFYGDTIGSRFFLGFLADCLLVVVVGGVWAASWFLKIMKAFL